MGNVKEQKCVFEAQANIEETWNELIALANVIDQDAPLEKGWKDGEWTCHGLCDSTSPVVGLLTYIWEMENFVYKEINLASRFKDHSKVATLGPFAFALSWVIVGA